MATTSGRLVRPSLVVAVVALVMTLPLSACRDEASSTAAAAKATAAAAETTSPVSTTVLPRSARPVFTGQAAAVERAFRAFLAAFEKQDIETVKAMNSAASRAAGKVDDLVAFARDYRIALFRVTAIDVDGDRADVYYENSIVPRSVPADAVTTILAQHDRWVREAGEWRFDGDTASAPGIPPDLPSVAVTLRQDAPITVGAIPAGEFALAVTNTTGAARGLLLEAIPADLDVEAHVADAMKDTYAGDPTGLLQLGSSADVAARGTGTMVFSGALPAGRYLLWASSRPSGDLLAREYVEFRVG